MAQTFYGINPVEVTPSTANSWVDVDVSSYVPSGATGAILRICKNAGTSEIAFGLRKNGSTDNRTSSLYGSSSVTNQQFGAMIGVDSNRIFEAYVGSATYIDIYIVGYTTSGVTFLTNAANKSLSTASTWTDINCSANAPSAIGLIFEVPNGGSGYGIRKNGSSDSRTIEISSHSWVIIGCDTSQICEGYTSNTSYNLFQLVGYITDGATFNTNATDLSLSSTSSYYDLSALPSSSVMGFIEVYTGSYYSYALRKNGASEDYYYIAARHLWIVVACDSNRIIEGKIENTNIDFYLVGYATEDTGISILPSSIASTLTLGTAKINLNIAVGGISPTVTFGAAKINLNISVAGIASTVSIGSLVVSQGLKLYPSSITSTVVIGSPLLSYDQIITPNGISSAIAFGDAVIVHISHILPAGIAGTVTIGIPELTQRIIPPPATKYAIELRTAAGALKQVFEAAYGVSYTQVVNEPHTLTFNLRGTDPKRSDIRWPYEFWLRNMVTGSVVKKFILTGESDSDSRNNLTTQINASSLLAQLGMETLQSDLTITNTVRNICIALLTHQRLTPAITLGTIGITTVVSMSWTGHPTLLACINNLLDAVGGYPDVNDDRELDWLDDVGEDKGQQIRQGKNIVALKQDIDWMSFATVLHPIGNSIKLSDKTVTMEVATKSADATYGYLTVPTDYVCFNEASLEILRKGTKQDLDAFGSIANVSPGTDWYVTAGFSAEWAPPKLTDGNDVSTRLGFLWAGNKWVSGIKFKMQVYESNSPPSETVVKRIIIGWSPDNFTTINTAWDSGATLNYGDGTYVLEIDFGKRFYARGLTLIVYASTPIGGDLCDYIQLILSEAGPAPVGTIEFFDESASWTNINDRQLSIPIASYHADDTYYLTYTLADYLKDLTAIATWSDEDGNGGEVSRSQTFNYADDVDTLLQWGQVYLPTVSYPPTTYHLEAALLNEVHANFSFDGLQKGSIVAVVHDDLGITVNARVLRINQPDLFNSPAEATIDISSQPKTLADAFRALWDRI